jgi:hypothetical protein
MANEGNQAGEKPCPDCGEMVRPNSVRCWNCGGFMRKDMAVKYQQMQANPKPLTYLDGSEPQSDAVTPTSDDDDDYELSIPLAQSMTFTIPPISAPAPTGPVVISPPQDTSDLPSLATSPLSQPAVTDAADELAPLPSLTPETSALRTERPKSEDDALFDLVTQDLSESEQRRRKRRPNGTLSGGVRTASGGFIIHCPYGCRFEVKESHRGMQGKCPRCRAPFIVPVDPPDYSVSKKAGDGAGAAAPTGPADAAGAFSSWLKDLHLHSFSPDKLKLKADSLLKEFVEYDVAFSSDQMLLVNIAKKGGGMFGSGDKKKPEAREAMLQHLRDGKPLAELPGSDRQVFTVDQISQLRVVQPVVNRAESLFAGIPVFGSGRIAVLLPFSDDPNAFPQYLSFSLSEFRAFSAVLQSRFGIERLGASNGVPLEDAFDEFPCHSTKAPIRVLRSFEYYKNDPSFKLATVGYKCGSCSLTLSEAGRAKDNLGGKDGKGMAKAKCPKCQQKFGDNPLISLAESIATETAAAE